MLKISKASLNFHPIGRGHTHSLTHSLSKTELSVIILFLFRPLNCFFSSSSVAPLSFRIIPNCLLVVRRQNRPRGSSARPSVRPFETASSSSSSSSSSVSVTSLKTLKEFTTTHARARPPAKDQRVQLSHGEGGGREEERGIGESSSTVSCPPVPTRPGPGLEIERSQD